jgi:RNA polymerase sigma-70 factor (ECF subfamily)
MTRAETDRLLQRVSAGDNGAFEELYLKTRRGVYAFLYTYVHNSADAEDLMQTVYLKVKMNIAQYRKGTNGTAWILQIAKNLALNELKKSARVELTDEVHAVDDRFEVGTVTDVMQRVLDADEQRIVTLHVLWGYKHREIAATLGCPTGTVTSKYKRAIKKMQDALKEDER